MKCSECKVMQWMTHHVPWYVPVREDPDSVSLSIHSTSQVLQKGRLLHQTTVALPTGTVVLTPLWPSPHRPSFPCVLCYISLLSFTVRTQKRGQQIGFQGVTVKRIRNILTWYVNSATCRTYLQGGFVILVIKVEPVIFLNAQLFIKWPLWRASTVENFADQRGDIQLHESVHFIVNQEEKPVILLKISGPRLWFTFH